MKQGIMLFVLALCAAACMQSNKYGVGDCLEDKSSDMGRIAQVTGVDKDKGEYLVGWGVRGGESYSEEKVTSIKEIDADSNLHKSICPQAWTEKAKAQE